MLNIIISKLMFKRLNCIGLVFLLFFFVSCEDEASLNHSDIEPVIQEIEQGLGLNRRNDLDILERLSIISNRIEETQIQVKYPIMFLDKPIISTDSTYQAHWAMTSFNPKELPVAYIETENKKLVRDTLKFNIECGCFTVKIKNFKKGKNEYRGFIYDDGAEYIFEGVFEGY